MKRSRQEDCDEPPPKRACPVTKTEIFTHWKDNHFKNTSALGQMRREWFAWDDDEQMWVHNMVIMVTQLMRTEHTDRSQKDTNIVLGIMDTLRKFKKTLKLFKNVK